MFSGAHYLLKSTTGLSKVLHVSQYEPKSPVVNAVVYSRHIAKNNLCLLLLEIDIVDQRHNGDVKTLF